MSFITRKQKRIIIISFFVLIWFLVIYIGYQKTISLQKIDTTENILQERQENAEKSNLAKSQQAQETLVKDSEQTTTQNQERAVEPEILIDEDVLSFLTPHDNQKFSSIDKLKDNTLLRTEQKMSTTGFFTEMQNQYCGEYLCYSGTEFLTLYNSFEKSLGLSTMNSFVYGEEIDTYIQNIAENRGYQKRGLGKSDEMVPFYGIRTRPEVRDAYIRLRDEMKEHNIIMHFVSGYRTAGQQKNIFLKKMGNVVASDIPKGKYDEKIMQVLNLSAFPGYSKHHSGYAADFGCGNDYLVYRFADTPCYVWLSKNNFENAKRFGFIPSYPNGVLNQGPNPEPWEFVWVGEKNITKIKK